MDTDWQQNYNLEVKKILRERHRVSWKKAISCVGFNFLSRFASAGNLTSRTAEAIAFCVKEQKKWESQQL